MRIRKLTPPALVAALVVTLLHVPAQADGVIGLVLMHGKGGMPAGLQPLADRLVSEGYLIERPEMCWSRRRIYDMPYLECLRDIDAAVERLKDCGATTIVVGGQSLGANAALAFGARHEGLASVIGMAPAHDPPRIALRPAIKRSLKEARALVAAGKGDRLTSFADVNVGVEFSVRTTPTIYLSFFARDSDAGLAANAAHVQSPLLWIAGRSDPTQTDSKRIFARAPNPKNRYVRVSADHLGTPDASSDAILAWLKKLDRSPD